MAQRIAPGQAFEHRLTVDARDIDVQGHASNVAILSWFIDAAVAHSDALGWDDAAYRELGSTFVVRRHEIDYLRLAKLGDRVTVRTWPSSIEAATAQRCYVATREDGEVVARGSTRWAMIDIETGRPARIPAAVRESFPPIEVAEG